MSPLAELPCPGYRSTRERGPKRDQMTNHCVTCRKGSTRMTEYGSCTVRKSWLRLARLREVGVSKDQISMASNCLASSTFSTLFSLAAIRVKETRVGTGLPQDEALPCPHSQPLVRHPIGSVFDMVEIRQTARVGGASDRRSKDTSTPYPVKAG